MNDLDYYKLYKKYKMKYKEGGSPRRRRRRGGQQYVNTSDCGQGCAPNYCHTTGRGTAVVNLARRYGNYVPNYVIPSRRLGGFCIHRNNIGRFNGWCQNQ